MALSTYAELQASLGGWLHRSDVRTTATGVGVDNVVLDWIALAEAELNATLRLRTMESDETLTTVAASRAVALPAGFIEPLGLWITWSSGNSPTPLRYVPVSQLDRSVVSAPPCDWAIDGTNIVFDSVCDQAYPLTLRMLKAFALSNATPTNWLLTNYPNLYLYGALRHSPLYLMQDARAAGWDALYGRSLLLLEEKEARANGLATLSVDPALRSRTPFNIYRG